MRKKDEKAIRTGKDSFTNVKESVVSKDVDVPGNPRTPKDCGGGSHGSRQSQLQFSN